MTDIQSRTRKRRRSKFRTALMGAAAVCATGLSAVPTAVATPALKAPSAPKRAFEDGSASFAILLGDDAVPYRHFFATVMPGETLEVGLAPHAPEGDYQLIGTDGRIGYFVEGQASWTAPDAPGATRTVRVQRDNGDEITLTVFVLQPTDAMDGESLNGYRIGAYPTEALNGLEIYEPPQGFIEVTEDNLNMRIAPHFTLRQFLCKQQQDHWPKYVLLTQRLLLKLEALMADVNAQGIQTQEFFVMSGYRTPWYNKAIGNTTTYSQHVYGGAADVYVDVAPRDGDMDDLNNDGVITRTDAVWLYDRAEALERSDAYHHLIGGLGVYDRNAAHGPFLHVDSRGYQARW